MLQWAYPPIKLDKFDTKMYLNFSIFRGQTSVGGGGTSLGPKTGTSVGWGGGLAKFRRMPGGPPQSPPGKKKTLPSTDTLIESSQI